MRVLCGFLRGKLSSSRKVTRPRGRTLFAPTLALRISPLSQTIQFSTQIYICFRHIASCNLAVHNV